jgi:preprotein translocase subunit SecA
VSDGTVSPAIPPLILHPERKERKETWIDKVETRLKVLPIVARARFGDPRVRKLIPLVNALENEIEVLDEKSVSERVAAVRVTLRREGLTLPAVAESFALVRETARRVLGLRHYDVQLAGGYALLRGAVAEMDTGEGKTLTATLTAATVALAGTPVHIVTVNDYLAHRDAETMGPLYEALGLRVGTIVHGLQPPERRAAYACDITYTSNKEIAFDYLRDRIALGQRPSNLGIKLRRISGRARDDNTVMRGLFFAIVDEADSVLVDEARTPLIISKQTRPDEERAWAETALGLVSDLEPNVDYKILSSERRVELTSEGRERLAELGEELGGVWRSSVRREQAAQQALVALNLFDRGDHYLVQDGKVQIVDEYTGRIMADRSWSDGLHQLIELKEDCEVTPRKVPVARITYQRFFRRYQQLAGMTGTAKEVAGELWSVYRLPVVRIPTNRPPKRHRFATRIFNSADDKWLAIAVRAAELQAAGDPVLIGTRSVAASETLSEFLTDVDVEHKVLNAAQDEHEAEIIAQAGTPGRITVATNMAGRGVDIAVDPEPLTKLGLHVILSERHDARRIDRQLEGRCGRQGEPGAVQAYLSLEDPLLELLPEQWTGLAAALAPVIRKPASQILFRWAQSRAERSHSVARQMLLKSDQRLGTLLAFSGGVE